MEPLPLADPLEGIHMQSPAVAGDFLTAFPDKDDGYDGYIFVGAFDREDYDTTGVDVTVGSHLTPEMAQEFADALWDMAQAMIDAR